MTSEELKKLQAPLKEKYREQPESATITLKAKGKVGEGITCKVDTGKAMVEAGLHKARASRRHIFFPTHFFPKFTACRWAVLITLLWCGRSAQNSLIILG